MRHRHGILRAMQRATVLAAGLALAACSHGEAPGAPDTPTGPAPATADAPAQGLPEPGCPVVESRNWTAAVRGAEGERRLQVAGEIVLPTPGYTVTLKEGPSDRRTPPGQHLLLELTPPDGMVSQVLTTVAVRYDGEATHPEYRAILVQCDNQVLVALTEIESPD